MCNNNLFKALLLSVSIGLFISCDKDYNEIGEGLIGENHFDLDSENFSVVAYNQEISPIQSNNLPINALGIYNNTAFEKTTASFATEVALATVSPVIGVNAVIDSVVIDIPYFVDVTKTTSITAAGVAAGNTYVLDSIYGADKAKIKLSIYESGRYMGQQTGVGQLFYTNQNTEFDGKKIGDRLNDATDKSQNDEFFFNPKQHVFSTTVDNVTTKTYGTPSMRLRLNNDFFKNKILNAPASALVTNEAFKRHLNGLYFKVEQSGTDSGSLAMMNFARGTITIKYKEDLVTTTATTRVDKTIVLNLTGNTASLLDKTNPNTAYTSAINTPDKDLGDEKLYLKGGEGSMAVLKLFGPDNFGDDGLTGTPNGVADELDRIRKNKWLINQASLILTVDAASMANSYEPERLYLYDFTNNATILDYFIAAASTSKYVSKFTFGGYLKRDATTQKRGVSYRINLTSHIRNLVKNTDAKNIELGLAVTEDINIADFYKLKTPSGSFIQAPVTSVMNPLGTILHGSNSTDANKKLKLEIYYTKPN
ncbi:DUF4270 domain-containing protein [Flavobacterium eburneipallidum]|uniref:DUF4270 domain-containing protein n=1 Tax=Flavobacterium eburneipallidum TaxID=3003263 RepID=UPI0022AC1F77|nr:DUF4270 domain-containing protein [Flavobacterium eburneipallidum]